MVKSRAAGYLAGQARLDWREAPDPLPTGLVTRLLVSAVLVLLAGLVLLPLVLLTVLVLLAGLVLLPLAVVALVLLALPVLVLRSALARLVLLAHAELLLRSVLTLLDLLWMLLRVLLGLVLQVVELAHCGLRPGRRLRRPSLTAPTHCRQSDALPGA